MCDQPGQHSEIPFHIMSLKESTRTRVVAPIEETESLGDVGAMF